MDVSPISAIRPVSPVRQSWSAPDVSRVFEVEYLGHSRDDEFTRGNRDTARGLEDEEAEASDEQTAGAEAEQSLRGASSVSCFA
jgi:hypothetical protein